VALSLWVVAGSAIGGLARYWLTIGVAMLLGPAFPWGTLLINLGGSFVIGAAAAATDVLEHVTFRAFLMVGVCGGFTTFSSFSLQTLELVQAGRLPAALAYVLASTVICLLAVWWGWAIGRWTWA
jgi:CrcB protein